MVLYKAHVQKINKVTRNIHKLLYEQEIQWTKKQKSLQKQRVLTKMAKAEQIKSYQDRLLIKCKTLGGPSTSIEELDMILTDRPKMQKVIVRTELSYYRQIHHSDIMNSKGLYKLNGISYEEWLENFLIF